MKKYYERIRAIIELIEQNQSFILTSHINPDGDGLGSELALYYLLKSLKKDVSIINSTGRAENYQFLDEKDEIITIYSPECDDAILNADVIMVLDISVMHRLGEVGKLVSESSAKVVCIDHHSTNSFENALKFIDEEAIATGELIYELFKQGEYEITPQIANCIYVAIMTDTGSFRFSNTNERAHAIAAELIRLGVTHSELYGNVYESNTWAKTDLFSEVCGQLHKEYHGKVAYMKITRAMFYRAGAVYDDIEGFVEYPRGIKGVQLSILFVEKTAKSIKLSLRSSNMVRCDLLAAEFDGGGHRNAAATVLDDMTIDEAVRKILIAAEKYLV